MSDELVEAADDADERALELVRELGELNEFRAVGPLEERLHEVRVELVGELVGVHVGDFGLDASASHELGGVHELLVRRRERGSQRRPRERARERERESKRERERARVWAAASAISSTKEIKKKRGPNARFS